MELIPTATTFLFVSWGVVGFFFFADVGKEYLYERRRRRNEELSFDDIARLGSRGKTFHAVFLTIMFCKILSMMSLYLDAECRLFSQSCSSVFFSLSEFSFFFFLFLFSNGWTTLSPININWFYEASYYLSICTILFFGTFYFHALGSCFVLYVFVPPLLFSLLNKNATYLQLRHSWVSDPIGNQISEGDDDYEAWSWTVKSLSSKLYAFTQTQTIISIYLFVYLFATFSFFFFILVLQWVWEDEVYPLILQGNCLWFVVYFYFLVGPRRAKEGLFWIPSFEDGWEERGFEPQVAAERIDAMKYHRKLISSYEIVTKNMCVIQYPHSPKKGEESGEVLVEIEREEGERLRGNMCLAVMKSTDHRWPKKKKKKKKEEGAKEEGERREP
mmetsp:Transcript_30489/g.47374  ORF Transcript_30489/g.47374 Transcript_30489/m.47374 type:complete len:387 (-) Transcript_30489:50-1210(-)